MREIVQLLRRDGPLPKDGLHIMETVLSPDNRYVAFALRETARCFHGLQQLKDADASFRRALKIEEVDGRLIDRDVTVVLHDPARCVQKLGRLDEAKGYCRRALKIKEADVGPDDRQIVIMLCVGKLRRTDEVEGYCRQALKIEEAEMGVGDREVGNTLCGLALGMFERVGQRARQKGTTDVRWRSKRPSLARLAAW